MRLYDIQEVQEAVQKAEADKQYHEEHRDMIEAEKLAKQKEVAKQKEGRHSCSGLCTILQGAEVHSGLYPRLSQTHQASSGCVGQHSGEAMPHSALCS